MIVKTYEVMVVVDVMGLTAKPMARFASYTELPYLPLPTADKSQVLISTVSGQQETFFPRQLSVRNWEKGGLTLFVTSKPSRNFDQLASRFRSDSEWEEWEVPTNGDEGE